MMCYTMRMRSITERFNIFIFITRLCYRIYDELHDWFVIHFTDSARMREPDEYPCPSATMTCPPEETVQLTAMCVSPRPAQNQDVVKTELAAELRDQAQRRFMEFGPEDARGSAFWDAANWLDIYAPQSAAGEGEACVCGHDRQWHPTGLVAIPVSTEWDECPGCRICDHQYPHDHNECPAPVPVSDEAEAAWQEHVGWDSYSLNEKKDFFAGYEASDQKIRRLQAERDDWERCARSLHESFHKVTNSYVQKLMADVREMYSEKFPETPVRKPEPECEIGKCKNSR